MNRFDETAVCSLLGVRIIGPAPPDTRIGVAVAAILEGIGPADENSSTVVS